MQFHRPFSLDQWHCFVSTSPQCGGGRGWVLGELFSADGELVASANQEGLVMRQPQAH